MYHHCHSIPPSLTKQFAHIMHSEAEECFTRSPLVDSMWLDTHVQLRQDSPGTTSHYHHSNLKLCPCQSSLLNAKSLDLN